MDWPETCVLALAKIAPGFLTASLNSSSRGDTFWRGPLLGDSSRLFPPWPAQHSGWPPQIRSPKPIRALRCLYGCAIGRQIKQSVVAQWNGFMNAHAAAQVVWVVEIPVDYFIPRERWRCAATHALSLLIGLLGSRTRVALRTSYRWRRGRLAHNRRSGSGVSRSQSRSSSCDPASAIAPNVVPCKATTLPWLATDDLHQQPGRFNSEARCSEFPLGFFLNGPARHSGWAPQIRSPKPI